MSAEPDVWSLKFYPVCQGPPGGAGGIPISLPQFFEPFLSYYCKRCNTFDAEHDIRGHVCAPNSAPNAAPNKIPAPNRVTESKVVAVSGRAGSGVDTKEDAPVARSSKWKAANPDRYRAYQRDLMRKRRAH